MRDHTHSNGGSGIAPPHWLNGWGRWITAEIAALRRENDWRWDQWTEVQRDQETRLRLLEARPKRRLDLSPIDWVRIWIAAGILGGALTKRIAWPDAGPILSKLLGG